jgi:hypothetical protein
MEEEEDWDESELRDFEVVAHIRLDIWVVSKDERGSLKPETWTILIFMVSILYRKYPAYLCPASHMSASTDLQPAGSSTTTARIKIPCFTSANLGVISAVELRQSLILDKLEIQ